MLVPHHSRSVSLCASSPFNKPQPYYLHDAISGISCLITSKPPPLLCQLGEEPIRVLICSHSPPIRCTWVAIIRSSSNSCNCNTYLHGWASRGDGQLGARHCLSYSSLLLLRLPSHMINAMWLFAQLLFMMFQWCCWWRQSLVLFQSLRCCVLINQGILPALLNGNFDAFNVAYVFLLQSSFVADCQMHVLFSLSSLS